ncbi:hypothetical protein CCHL11_02286 [Colletotrichum chlorophyti]|uniref:Uncharacterized protein n=1 Tax=Colletotrichum chlorophyti TaxID=708187 RepID=A0A1Q8S5R2_9PEZI|nr:hypothetical protein CCHL11_02286 [Colletotrichum chlorophyti]
MATMIDNEQSATPIDCQLQSPLFNVLPGEIRNEIFALALVQFEDDENAYPVDSYWRRPGFSGPYKSSSSLLQTRKRAHLEGQKGWSGDGAFDRFFDTLTPQQSEVLQYVRLFTQMFWLEDGSCLNRLFRHPNFRPAKLTMTIRYSDWWFWEDDEPLRMSEYWLAQFCGSPGLRELKVEYETVSRKKKEMMKIVERNKKWRLAIEGEDGPLSAEGTSLVEWKWTGMSRFEGREWLHHGGADTMEYVVVTDTWRYLDLPTG